MVIAKMVFDNPEGPRPLPDRQWSIPHDYVRGRGFLYRITRMPHDRET